MLGLSLSLRSIMKVLARLTNRPFEFLQYVSEIESQKSNDAYLRNAFNVHISDQIASDRAIPDTRQPEYHAQSSLDQQMPICEIPGLFTNH